MTKRKDLDKQRWWYRLLRRRQPIEPALEIYPMPCMCMRRKPVGPVEDE